MEFVKASTLESKPIEPSDIQLDDDKPFDPKRVWVGNIDTTLSEYVVLKLVQPFGELKKLDFLYHKTGPEAGKCSLFIISMEKEFDTFCICVMK